jgi:hypothetical protein
VTLVRLKLAGLAIGIYLVAGPGTAQAATYSGTLNDVPGGQIQLTFEREGGHLYLGQLDWGQAPWHCENGTESVGSGGSYNPPDGLVSHRRFRIRRSAPENNYAFLVRGEFGKRGKASGVLRYMGQGAFPDNGVCDTERLGWKATKEP